MTELVVHSIGHRGDGIADGPAGPVFVAGGLPGDRVDAAIVGDRATVLAILEPSPHRQAAPCRHFGVCGGCSLQTLAPGLYADFKRRLVVDALADRGLHPEVEPALVMPPDSRRRATFAGLMAGRRPLVGFTERGSHRIVPLTECRVSVPALLGALPALEAIAARVDPRKSAIDLAVTLTESGLDVDLSGVKVKDADRLRLDLVEIAARFDLARLSLAGEVLVERRPPVVTIDGIPVALPPGAFLQATRESEAALADTVAGAVGKARRVLDLYAGVGTFSLRLARQAEVTAAEGSAAAVAALDRAARGMVGRHRVTAERRDLSRRPYVEKELERFDAVVFDPPRAGAPEQSGWLAKSKVPTVVAVSCNPATFARDLRVLVDGGYRIERVEPVDQFLWSSHVEVVALLKR